MTIRTNQDLIAQSRYAELRMLIAANKGEDGDRERIGAAEDLWRTTELLIQRRNRRRQAGTRR